MKIVKTKIHKPKGSRYWKLFVKINNKYKVHFKSTNEEEVLKEREILRQRPGIIETPLDVKINKLSYYKLMVVNTSLNHGNYNETINYLIDKAHTDFIDQK